MPGARASPDGQDEAEKWSHQLRKGSTKLAVLHLIVEKERYGYEIVTEVNARTRGRLRVTEGNLYPTLHALERDGHVTSAWQEVEPGVPARKYYRATALGRRLHARMVDAWRSYQESMGWLLEDGK